MEIISVSPLKVAALRWQARPDTWVLTVVSKATFRLEPGESKLAEAQDHLHDDDNYWDDDPDRSVRFASDLAPYKARADVVVTGSAHAPRGAPVADLLVQLITGAIDKAVAVRADRAWTLAGALRDGPRFTKMSLRWERAAGGPGTTNPVGVAHDVPNSMGEIALPNLVPPAYEPSQRGERIAPVGFGPIAPTWPSRREKLGVHASTFQLRDLPDSLLPREIDATFFQVAPLDQQLPSLTDDAQLVLVHMHPQHPRLVTRLPGLRPRAFIERPAHPIGEIPVRPDTLTIDADRGTATLVWRGQWMLPSRDEPGRILVALERRDSPVTWQEALQLARGMASVARSADAPTADETGEIESLSEEHFSSAEDTMLPIAAALSPAEAQAVETLFLTSAPVLETLPFAPGDRPTDTLRRAEQAAAEIRAAVLPVGWAPPSPVSAAPSPNTGPFHPHIKPPPTAGATPSQPFSLQPLSSQPPASPPFSSPLSHQPFGSSAVPLAPPMIAGRPVFLDEVEPPPATPPPKPVEVAIASSLALATGAAGDAAKLGVAGFSNAAADAHGALARSALEDNHAPRLREPSPEDDPRRVALPREAFELLWHSPTLVRKLRQSDDWRRMFLESDLEPPAEGEAEVMSEEDAETPEEADRRRVADALSRGVPVNIAAVREAVRRGVRPSGRFAAPVLLLDGELEISFDEVETLRAVTAAAAPFAPIDKRIKEAVDAAQEALRSSWISASGAAADTFAERIREAFTSMRKEMPAGRRPIAADYLDTTASRTLTAGRHYQKRPVYGEPHVRASLRLIGGEERMPVYLSEDAARQLPIASKHRVRLFVEIGPRVDFSEASKVAGKGVAVAVAVGIE